MCGKTGFTRLDDFPRIVPPGFSQPWLLAFTTMARRGDTVIDFTAGAGESWRRCLEAALAPLSLIWLSLEHGSKFAIVNSKLLGAVSAQAITGSNRHSPVADAAIVTEPGCAVAFTTADCLPIICVSNNPRLVVGIHAGWRSLAAGIIEGCIEQLQRQYDVSVAELQVWIGPAIAAADYEVGKEVRQALIGNRRLNHSAPSSGQSAPAPPVQIPPLPQVGAAFARTDLGQIDSESGTEAFIGDSLARPAIGPQLFTPTRPGHYLADLPAAATAIFTALGVPAAGIQRHHLSTAQSPMLHSVRRDRELAGRMATIVGIIGD